MQEERENIKDIKLTFRNKRKGDIYVCRTRSKEKLLQSISMKGFQLIDSKVYEKDGEIDETLTLVNF